MSMTDGGAMSGSGGSVADASPSNIDSGPVGRDAGACEQRPTLAQRKAPPFPATQVHPAGLLLRMMNNCPMTLWVQVAGTNAPGGVVQLDSKIWKDFDWAGVGGRIQIFKNAAPGGQGSLLIQFLEMNAFPGKALNVNLSNVDWIALPTEVNGIGPGADCRVTACYAPLADMLKGCPPQLLDAANGKCVAPYHYCSNMAHAAEPFCTALTPLAQQTVMSDPDCKGGAVGTPADIFGCAGFWGTSAPCCAKVHRGVSGPAKSDTNNCLYYQTAPYDVYAAYSHQICPYTYAFAYDDFNDQSGFMTCSKPTEMDITFCPGDL
jgi:hypothetical protein